MRIKALMMCKNEGRLLEAWFAHHGSLLGFENLIVLDNGSNDRLTLDVLADAQARGAHVDYSFKEAEDFVRKGDRIGEHIIRLDAADDCDFYFPLDCDEFLAVERGEDDLDFTKGALDRALSPFAQTPDLLTVGSYYDNHPSADEYFHRHCDDRKIFFAAKSCLHLEHGFHQGQTTSGKRKKSSIAYMHFHYRDAEDYRLKCRAKLEPFMAHFGVHSLDEFFDRQLPGFHLVPAAKMERGVPYENMPVTTHRRLHGVTKHFASLGMSEPFKQPQFETRQKVVA